MSIWVCGEVLIDLLPGTPERVAVVGGGPANTAKALARLGYDVDFIDGISSDAYGVSARKELDRDGVGLSLSLASDKPTCTATVTNNRTSWQNINQDFTAHPDTQINSPFRAKNSVNTSTPNK